MEKIRPVVVLSSDIFTGLKVKVCVPVTGWKNTFDSYDWFVKLNRTISTIYPRYPV
jgi:hypothetical protein